MNIQNYYLEEKILLVCTSMEKHKHVQKCLLLDLSELYQAFKNQHLTIKISFAKFCSTRPKWC